MRGGVRVEARGEGRSEEGRREEGRREEGREKKLVGEQGRRV
jgi:hypothetical protein